VIAGTKAKEEARKIGTFQRVTSWKISVPTPAVKRATPGSSPVRRGTSTRAPNATKSIWTPWNTVLKPAIASFASINFSRRTFTAH